MAAFFVEEVYLEPFQEPNMLTEGEQSLQGSATIVEETVPPSARRVHIKPWNINKIRNSSACGEHHCRHSRRLSQVSRTQIKQHRGRSGRRMTLKNCDKNRCSITRTQSCPADLDSSRVPIVAAENKELEKKSGIVVETILRHNPSKVKPPVISVRNVLANVDVNIVNEFATKNISSPPELVNVIDEPSPSPSEVKLAPFQPELFSMKRLIEPCSTLLRNSFSDSNFFNCDFSFAGEEDDCDQCSEAKPTNRRMFMLSTLVFIALLTTMFCAKANSKLSQKLQAHQSMLEELKFAYDDLTSYFTFHFFCK